MKRIIHEAFLVLILAGSAACMSTACMGAVGSEPADAHEPSTGTWQKHQYSFVSMGFTSTYSCDGLADQLKRLLLAAGARADAKAHPGACASDLGQPEKLARADLVFYTLMPDSDTKPQDGSRAKGAWRAVTLAPRSPRELGPGDCELVEQFRAQVLPMFATRNVDDRTTCIPHQDSGSIISLKFESFAAAPAVGATGVTAEHP
jgi:hypothetical protein